MKKELFSPLLSQLEGNAIVYKNKDNYVLWVNGNSKELEISKEEADELIGLGIEFQDDTDKQYYYVGYTVVSKDYAQFWCKQEDVMDEFKKRHTRDRDFDNLLDIKVFKSFEEALNYKKGGRRNE